MTEPLDTTVTRAVYEDARFSDEFCGRRSRTDVPALCDALDEARREIERLRANSCVCSPPIPTAHICSEQPRSAVWIEVAAASRLAEQETTARAEAAEADRNRLAAQIERVRAVHLPCKTHPACCDSDDFCHECGQDFPCLTISALDGPAEAQP